MKEFQKTNPLARGNENIKPLDVHAEHAKVKKLVRDEIKKLYTTFSGAPSVNITIDRFLGCLSPCKELHDPGRLPVYTIVPRSSTSNKKSCVWAIVSCLVQAYWEYEFGTQHKSQVIGYLNDLKKINEHYPKMNITGAENKGYWLEL